MADFISRRGKAYRALHQELALGKRELTDTQWLDLIAAHPRLLRRPILTDGRRTLVGFSQQRYAELFDR